VIIVAEDVAKVCVDITGVGNGTGSCCSCMGSDLMAASGQEVPYSPNGLLE